MSEPSPISETPATPEALEERKLLVAGIDASCRGPVLFFFVSGLFWLLVASCFALISSIKLHAPGFLAGSAWLSYGRVVPAFDNLFLYGFACQAGFGIVFWMLCRLGRTGVAMPGMVLLGGLFWNLGVFVGAWAVLAGGGTGFPGLEFPRYAAVILFAAYILIGGAGVLTFYARRVRPLYVSQWYLLAALFWFPWIYSTAVLLLLIFPVRGALQIVVNGWFNHCLIWLWLAPLGLAVIVYFIPKILRRPLHSRSVASFSFWTFAFFAGWGGLNGKPVPAWIVSAGIVGTIFLIVPGCTYTWNYCKTLSGAGAVVKENITLRFVVWGAIGYSLATLALVITSFRDVTGLVYYTHFTSALTELTRYGFVTLVFFGAMYYIVPRVTRLAWPSAGLIRVHFWCAVSGIIIYVVALGVGGLVEGAAMHNPDKEFLQVMKLTLPFVGISTIGILLMAVGHLVFLFHLLRLLSEGVRGWVRVRTAPAVQPAGVTP